MSVFNVHAVLKERPELVGIIGKSKISMLQHSKVSMLTAETLNPLVERSTEHYIVSRDGLLLGPKQPNFFQRLLSPHGAQAKALIATLIKESNNVSYIAEYATCGYSNPCTLIIYKTPRDQTLVQLIQSMESAANQEVTEV